MYQQIATERDREERGLNEKKAISAEPATVTNRTEKQRTGNTICVSGNSVTEEFLRNQFVTFGKIVSVSMEIEKGRGFITFIKTESAERAINDMHSKTVSGISLQVQLARRQPQIEPINHASSSVVWSTLGKNFFRFVVILFLKLFFFCVSYMYTKHDSIVSISDFPFSYRSLLQLPVIRRREAVQRTSER